MKRRKYRLLYSARAKGKPGPKGPSKEVIPDTAGQALVAIVSMKQRNPRYGCPRIAQQINAAFGHAKDSLWSIDLFRCESILLKSHWVLLVMDQCTRSIIGFAVHDSDVDGATLCRMFNEEIKSIPYTPISHPFVERLIGSIRREFLDQSFFWNDQDLTKKLASYQAYYNRQRTHSSLEGQTPFEISDQKQTKIINLKNYRWQTHCRGLFQLPTAA
jgi:transposase InsO family protein